MTGAHLGGRGACRRRSCSATAAPREGARRRGHADARHHPQSPTQVYVVISVPVFFSELLPNSVRFGP